MFPTTPEDMVMNRASLRVVMVASFAALLAGCPTAAPPPCQIQRPPLGGYTIKFTLRGTAPAGCENNLPPIYADNWRIDGYSDQQIYMKADSMPYPDRGGDPDPSHSVLGKGTLPAVPDAQSICTIPDVTPMEADIDPLGLGPGQETYIYKVSQMQFLDGARYQGSTFAATVDITFGTCTGTYDAQGLTPSQLKGCVSDDNCDPFADPSKGRPTGSGINPDYAIACTMEDWVTEFLTGDPTVGICFFTEPFPGLKK